MFPGGDDNLVEGRIVACEPPRLLAFEWFSTGGNTVVHWELTPLEDACRLVFHQTGLTPWWFLGGAAGWADFIDDMVAVAHGGKALEEEPGHHQRAVERYRRQYGAFVPGFDVATALRHNEPPVFVTPAGEGLYDIRYVRRWRLPLERVWAAITESERLADWLCVAKIDLRVGGAVELSWPSVGHSERHIILELEPPKRMVWGSIETTGPQSVIRWELYQERPEIGVRLVFTQRLVPSHFLLGVSTGWHAHLHELPDAAQRPAPLPWSAEREQARISREVVELIPTYRERLARDAPDASGEHAHFT
jgi:uncharacterized protein YndB with AHSA1/START domain